MIPKHKCTALCDPEEKIHVLPNMWAPGKTVADFAATYNRQPFEVIKVQEEADVTVEDLETLDFTEMDLYHNKVFPKPNEIWVGYLVWLKDKE